MPRLPRERRPRTGPARPPASAPAGGARGAARAAGPAAGPPGPRPALFRDPWLLLAWAPLALLVLRSLGVPFGEPVADDFDHLHHALFAAERAWWGSGGSASFWRPLAYQGYYGLLTGVILARPAWITLLHVLLAGIAIACVHSIARRVLPGPAAAIAAGGPWLLESARALLAVPVHFVDLGLIVFSALAWRAADAGRLPLALAALLAALHCKETAVATALVLPLLARPGPRAGRRAWILATAALTTAWAVSYLLVRARLGLALPHGLESGLAPSLLVSPERHAWAAVGTLRSLLSLPMNGAGHEGPALLACAALALAAGLRLARDGAARARLAAARPLALGGLAWGLLGSATLLTVHPVWSPERVVFPAMGFAVAGVAVLAAAQRALPWALALLQLVLLALAPAAPPSVTREAPDRGAFVDFERLARLQRLMREARTTLRREFPELPAGARVAMLHPPYMADYAAGDHALQVWYRDSTLHWVRWEEMARDSARTLAGALEFQEHARPPFRRVEPEALRLLFVAGALDRASAHAAAAESLVLAEARLRDRRAHHTLGRLLGLRAWCSGGAGNVALAESLARQSLAIAPENSDGHLTMSAIHNGRGEWRASLAHLDTIETWYPGYEAAALMRRRILERMGAAAPPR
jgi:hypothetical protein